MKEVISKQKKEVMPIIGRDLKKNKILIVVDINNMNIGIIYYHLGYWVFISENNGRLEDISLDYIVNALNKKTFRCYIDVEIKI